MYNKTFRAAEFKRSLLLTLLKICYLTFYITLFGATLGKYLNVF